MVISVEHGLQKVFLIILSLILIFLGSYPYTYQYLKLTFLNYQYIPAIITVVAIIQLIAVIRMKRPRVY